MAPAVVPPGLVGGLIEAGLNKSPQLSMKQDFRYNGSYEGWDSGKTRRVKDTCPKRFSMV
ncbi:hypothetical protein GCM10011571_04160 [Marinithermofilum abyssi]|uniref:Uncharacterized protein n=1 Tax=Marinithermofilum abyssi TaxID=1571185 RepID=A0A8J2VBJ4_9BACL|nr:hypothetical protein GCM10011571_04160 [Marinithermofilum abyssi]